MNNLLVTSPFLWITLTIGLFLLAGTLYKKYSFPIFNPLIFTIISLILLLKWRNLSYDMYEPSGKYIEIFITPATVALAIKLEKNYHYLKKYFRSIFIGIISGVLLHTIIIIALSLILKLDAEMIGTLIPKSITTAIAISVSDSLGGIVSLTVALVIVTGIIGTVLAPLVFKLAKIEHPIAQGVALGSSAHALGTTKAIELGEIQGAMSSLSLVVTGIVTVIFIPLVEFLLNLFF